MAWLTAKQRQSEGAKLSWRRRKARAAALGQRSRLQQILDATTPEKTAPDLAKEFGVTDAYIRKCWAMGGLPPRPPGRRSSRW